MIKKFNEIIKDKYVLDALKEFRYDIPLEVQRETIPHILGGKDLIVMSQTGSGKTAAFSIPLCDMIEKDYDSTSAIIIVPTRELAIQVSEEINLIGKFKGVKSIPLYGKQAMEIQRKNLKEGFHIVVATPGRLIDHLKRKSVKGSEIKYLVIDEADMIFDMGFLGQIEEIMGKLPLKKQTMLFSATIPEELDITCKKYMIDPIKIQVESKDPVTENIKQAYFETKEIDKFKLFMKIMQSDKPNSCIVFCNTRERVEKLGKLMSIEGFKFCEIHGGLDQKTRFNNIMKFKKGKVKYLIATDVAARGIHVNKLSHVINYNVPFENESYVHRIGRTGRLGETGVAITFVTVREYERFKELQQYLGYNIKNLGGTSKFSSKVEKKSEKVQTKNKRTKKTLYDISSGTVRIRVDCGKLRNVSSEDILRTVSSIRNIEKSDVLSIKVFNKHSFVDVNDKKATMVIDGLRKKKIKGMSCGVKKA